MKSIVESFIVKDDFLKINNNKLLIENSNSDCLYEKDIESISGVEFIEPTQKNAGCISFVYTNYTAHSFYFHKNFEDHYKKLYDYLIFYSK